MLDEYVKDTLVQIVNGINEANKELIQKGAFVPSDNIHSWGNATIEGLEAFDNKEQSHLVRNVDFDIAVAVKNEKANGGKAGLEVMSVQLGKNKNSSLSSSSVNRIKFSLPLALPFQNKQDEDNR